MNVAKIFKTYFILYIVVIIISNYVTTLRPFKGYGVLINALWQ